MIQLIESDEPVKVIETESWQTRGAKSSQTPTEWTADYHHSPTKVQYFCNRMKIVLVDYLTFAPILIEHRSLKFEIYCSGLGVLTILRLCHLTVTPDLRLRLTAFNNVHAPSQLIYSLIGPLHLHLQNVWKRKARPPAGGNSHHQSKSPRRVRSQYCLSRFWTKRPRR